MSALPPAFLERLSKIIPQDNVTAVLQSFEKRRAVSFRVNTLKASPENIRDRLASKGLVLEKVDWYPDALILKQGTLSELQETGSYKNGEIYIQGLSSMLPALVLDPKPGETVLDICAAPGSKTSQLFCLMKGLGTLIANEKNRARFFKLKANMENQFDQKGPKLTFYPGEYFGKHFKNYFDKILVDAPCSSEGRFHLSTPKSYAYWKPAKIKERAHQQKILLAAAISAARPGAKVVYSTCTFAPEENEAILEWAVAKWKEKIQFEKIQLSATIPVSRGLTGWNGKEYSLSSAASIRILPSENFETFYIAAINC